MEDEEDDPQPATSSTARTRPVKSEEILPIRILIGRTPLSRLASRTLGSRSHLASPGALSSTEVHLADLKPSEQRVLGCLVEKRWTTPDQYPLSINALRLACNQLTNRDPVTDYDETTVREAAERLQRYGLARMASGHGSRAVKYRHLAEEALSLDRQQLAVLAVLLLRGPQTPGELKARTERMASFASLAEVERALETLITRGYARRLARRPGQKEDRFEQLLGGEASESIAGLEAAASPFPAAPGPALTAGAQPELDRLVDRLAALEDEVAVLRQELSALRDGMPADLEVGAPD